MQRRARLVLPYAGLFSPTLKRGDEGGGTFVNLVRSQKEIDFTGGYL